MSTIYDDTDVSYTGIVERLLDFADRRADLVGGVARIMLEAVARELAIFYATLDRAYQSGFIDTATGPALDRVVAVLGIQRARAGRRTGKVEFSRSVATEYEIVIPAGWRVTGVDAGRRLSFETVEDVTIARGETRVLVEVQEVLAPGVDTSRPSNSEALAPDADRSRPINPGALTIMPRPLLGVERVRNVEPMRQRQTDETDDQLRARARSVLRENQRGSSDGIAAAVREQGVAAVEVRDDDDDLPPGVIRVIIKDPRYADDKGLKERVAEAVRDAKPAGIRAQIVSQVTVNLEVTLELELVDPRLDERGRTRIIAELTDALVKASAQLPTGATIRSEKVLAAVLSHAEIAGVHGKALKLRGFDPSGRPQLSGDDVYLDTLEVAALEAADVKITWYRRPVLRVELVARIIGTADATQAIVREVVKQYNDFVRSGGAAGGLFKDLSDRLKARAVDLLDLTAVRDGISVTESLSRPDLRTLKLRAGEILEIADLEVLA